MSYTSIAQSKIPALDSCISSLDDQPGLSAADLKAYFDQNPEHLRRAHNSLADALTNVDAAAELGFHATDGVPANTIQQAVESVQQQLGSVALGAVPDASIPAEKLTSAVQQQLNQSDANAAAITVLQQQTDTIRPSGAQFSLMVLALADGCPQTLTDELATAALGAHLTTEAYDLGTQLAWLCRWKNSTLPSNLFCSKQTLSQIFADSSTLAEIASLTPVRQLISLSAEISHSYRTALDNAG